MNLKKLTPIKGSDPRESLHRLLDYALDNDLSVASGEQSFCTGREIIFRRFSLTVEVWEEKSENLPDQATAVDYLKQPRTTYKTIKRDCAKRNRS